MASPRKQDAVPQASHPSTREVKAGGAGVQGHLQLSSEFEDSLGNRRSCSKETLFSSTPSSPTTHHAFSGKRRQDYLVVLEAGCLTRVSVSHGLGTGRNVGLAGSPITHVGEFLRTSTESRVPRVRKHLWSMVSKSYRRPPFRLPLWTPDDKTQIQNGATGSEVSHHQVRAKLCKVRGMRQRDFSAAAIGQWRSFSCPPGSGQSLQRGSLLSHPVYYDTLTVWLLVFVVVCLSFLLY